MACAYLGDMYYLGLGLKKDYKEAVKLYQRGVDNGNNFSAKSLGDCYLHGHGVEKNDAIAFDLFLKASDGDTKLALSFMKP